MNNKIYANPVGIIKKDIYVIKNDINQKVYVGQSKNVKNRFKSHCKNTSKRSLLSKDIQKYGKEHFWYEIIESQIENYNDREIYWIKELNSLAPNGYNIQEGGNKPPIFYGDQHRNTKISDEQVKKLKQDLLNTSISLNELAKKYNISKKQVLRINQGTSRACINEQYPIRKRPNINGKLTESDVDEIIDLLKYTYRFNGQIAREYGVDVHAIDKINNGVAHRRANITYPIRNWKSSGVVLFTYEQVTDIINKLKNTKISIHKIAKEYGVNDMAIHQINTGTSKKYRRENINYPIRHFNKACNDYSR